GVRPYCSRTDSGSPRRSKASVASVCMRKAVSIAWMRASRNLREGLGLFVARAQAGEVEVGTLNQGAWVGAGRRGELPGFEFVEYEEIDLFSRPCRLFDRGGRGLAHRPKRPPPATGFRVGGERFLRRPRRRPGARVGSAHLDPLLKPFDLLWGELGLGRHGEVGVGPADGLDQAAFFDLAGDHYRAVVPAPGDARPRIEQQASPHLAGLGRMALVTALGQDRPDVLLEERHPFLR